MIITGSILLASTALPGLIGGAYCITQDNDDFSGRCTPDEGRAAMTMGILALGIGTPLLLFGIRRAKRYAQWKRDRGISITPATGRTAQGTHTAGFSMRF